MRRPSTFQVYLVVIALLFAGYVATEYYQPKPVNWSTTYINKDKIPYGTYVLFDQLPRLLGTADVVAVRQPIYQQLTGDSEAEAMLRAGRYPDQSVDAAIEEAIEDTDNQQADTTTGWGNSATDTAREAATTTTTDEEDEDQSDQYVAANQPDLSSLEIPLRDDNANYIFVNEQFSASELDGRALLKYVARGNDVFIAAEQFGGFHSFLTDSLGIRVNYLTLPTKTSVKGLMVSDSVDVQFTNPAVAGRRYRLPGAGASRRLLLDSGRVGRTLATDTLGRAVMVRLDHGRGHFYFCTVPMAFTNYYFLRPGTQRFAGAALAYLPVRPTWWDEYQKQGPVGEQSLLRVLIAHDALRTAYYMALAGTLLFVFVYARRRQRIIPTIKPLPNTTLLFTRTVASLYRAGSNHALIAEKKVSLFLDYLRTRFHETSPDLNDGDFRERLSQKAGMPLDRIEALVRQMNFALTSPQLNDQQLLKLSKAIAEFRRETR